MDQMISTQQTAPVDVTIDNFMAEVIEGSKATPTVVQFWAPWCGPCKQLGPVLEKVVGANAGKVRMVRVNIDDNQQIAQQMRVQSVIVSRSYTSSLYPSPEAPLTLADDIFGISKISNTQLPIRQ